MYKTQAEAAAPFFRGVLCRWFAGARRCDIVVAPSFTAIAAAVEAAQSSNQSPFGGARRVLGKRRRIHRRDLSPQCCRKRDGRYVIHHRGIPKRRQFFSEKPATQLAKKNESRALLAGPHAHRLRRRTCWNIRRGAGRTEEICETQFTGGTGAR